MAIEKFKDELGTDLNKYQVTLSDGTTYEVKLLRKATITQQGTLLNASKLNELVDQINTNATNISTNATNISNNETKIGILNVAVPLKADKTEIPTKVSELTNDSNYATRNELPTVNNGTLTIQKNGATIGTFTANSSIDITTNITIPTSLSEFENDNYFLRLNSYYFQTGATLPSSGLYLLAVQDSTIFSGRRYNLGIIRHDNNTQIVSSFYWTVSGSLNHYHVLLTNLGVLKLMIQTGTSTSEISGVTFLYIKLL